MYIDEYPEFFYWTIGVFHPKQNAAIDDSLDAEVWSVNTFDQARHVFYAKFCCQPRRGPEGAKLLGISLTPGADIFSASKRQGIPCADEKGGAARNHRLCWWQPRNPAKSLTGWGNGRLASLFIYDGFFGIHPKVVGLGISEPSTGTLYVFFDAKKWHLWRKNSGLFMGWQILFPPNHKHFARLKEGNVWVDDFFLFPIWWDMLLRSLEGTYHYK